MPLSSITKNLSPLSSRRNPASEFSLTTSFWTKWTLCLYGCDFSIFLKTTVCMSKSFSDIFLIVSLVVPMIIFFGFCLFLFEKRLLVCFSLIIVSFPIFSGFSTGGLVLFSICGSPFLLKILNPEIILGEDPAVTTTTPKPLSLPSKTAIGVGMGSFDVLTSTPHNKRLLTISSFSLAPINLEPSSTTR